MAFSHWNVDSQRALIATAVHNGHDLRPEVEGLMALDDDTRLREEDPHTGLLASYLGSYVTAERSRFEVDLNRPPEEAVYVDPDDSWGLQVWKETPSEELIDRSRRLHAEFFSRLGETLEELVERHGGFVLYDVHSYNHRRQGPAGDPDNPAESPVVNLGTGSLPPKWRPVADAFLTSFRQFTTGGNPVDARENVRFKGRHVAQFVHDRFGEVGCALAIEFKKVFMDEWTHELDEIQFAELGVALAKTGDSVQRAWELAWR